MNDPMQGFGKLVPGFEFLQEMMKSAGSAMPSFTQWVAPTLDPKELEKRIGELRTVQFWLEQNARMLSATIQAMEVQRMTLATLESMNVPMDTLRDSLKVTVPSPPPAPAAGPGPDRDAAAAKPGPSGTGTGTGTGTGQTASAGLIDPMQWWGALTQQFATLATNTMAEALKDSGSEAVRQRASDMVKQSFETAQHNLRQTMAPLQPAGDETAPARKAPARRGGAKGDTPNADT
ncbi:PhaM family polyhydroxyalkanoate granule multifunctional regulatory protein [Caldimonas brevitalea]|uniref:Uncharacterized protein n=1 Tax=Caldimonas brevitalea TaxID=413882 RepID=A0A0G3BQU8_9BURK|nr:PhaM family polyhydroxyalkanoate granule multifunctional regulatory protein [Caldimonas brevitalea]AKJ31779.1 hypothetical protein AAW51_5088 [Caldimonas brevitalea]